MSLRINTNVAALNSYNNLNANQAKLEGAFQQLSSGLRINKAADDAAGLSIAQGLTSQINGLTQAVSNANDGINVAQIADGALGTVQDILQRMRGLVVKAGNEGTQDAKSLGAIQQEVKNLNTQLDNISKQTKFGQTNLLNGEYNKLFQVGSNGGDTILLDLSGANVASDKIGGVNLNTLAIAANGAASSVTLGFNANSADAGTQFAAFLGQTGDAAPPAAFTDAFDTTQGAFTISRASNGAAGWEISQNVSGDDVVVGRITGGTDGVYTVSSVETVDGAEVTKTVGQIDGTVYDEDFAWDGSAVADTSALPANAKLDAALQAAFGTTPLTGHDHFGIAADGTVTSYDNGGPAVSLGDLGTVTEENGVYTITNQAGDVVGRINANEDAAATATGDVSYTSGDAEADLESLEGVINSISEARSRIGAVQNQLSYTVSNLQTAITNVTASRSNLTDADLAQQVTAMTQSQILTQAATSVLAQANSAPQAILRLLQ